MSKIEAPSTVVENSRAKMLWHFQIQSDKQVMANQLAIVLVNKHKKKAVVMDVEITSD